VCGFNAHLLGDVCEEADLHTASKMQTLAKSGHCALARANHVFGTDEKRIRTKNMVIDKSNNALGLFLYKIADCARTAFRPSNIATLQPGSRIHFAM